MGKRPINLQKALSSVAELHGEPGLSAQALFKALAKSSTNDPLSLIFHQRLASWDYSEPSDWTAGTARNTLQRRSTIYDKLGLNEAERKLCDEHFPYAPALDPPISITDVDGRGWHPWYSPEREGARSFYWSSYFDYLRDRKHWEAKNLAALDESTKDVVQRLADPEWQNRYQSKGLVVGFVQSGKTANFTGVIARAADAGFRLFIVLSGTINILRDQTQRRMDKELLGRELCNSENYETDEDYDDFISYHGLPSHQGAFDWERLTGSKDDFKSLHHGIAALEFRRQHPSRPFFEPQNLHPERARLLVVKKNSVVLGRLLADLQRVAERISLSEIPTLVIDDESDQASINTLARSPSVFRRELAKERKQRSKINEKIVDLLRVLPRSQYVGYTATPFANVFIDPEDTEDLFPSDFIVGLPRPEGYMGVSDFYDDTDFPAGDYSSNRHAHVRFVRDSDEASQNLPQALDAFVLSGALKLYREKHGNGRFRFRHHTMLIHNSPRVNVHAGDAQKVERMFTAANYLGSGAGQKRLQELWEGDFRPVSLARAASLPFPTNFRELLPHVGECCRRIDSGKPVLIINGDNKDDSPNFEKTGVWKILVGGTKLSRGYTVEGLTVSYYRRRAGAADTLMQMGRWFGFRSGYKDLVRLYIGDHEQVGTKANSFINLYEAFRATCQDEEEFREQLKRYSSLQPPERITPKQVPPLVSQHLLPPTSPNKMFNARITFINLGGEWKERTVAPCDDASVRHNANLLRKLIAAANVSRKKIRIRLTRDGKILIPDFPALIGSFNVASMSELLDNYRWAPGFEKITSDVLEFLHGTGERSCGIDSWLLLAPQMTKPKRTWSVDGLSFGVRERNRVETNGRYKAYSEPMHRAAAEYFAGLLPGSVLEGGEELRNERQGVFLFYPVLSDDEAKTAPEPTMGFAILFPKNNIRKQIVYTIQDPSRSDAIVVPVE